MEYNNKNEMHQFDLQIFDHSEIDLLTHLKNIDSVTVNSMQTEPTKPKSALATQMDGLSFDEQKKLLNKMAVYGNYNKPSQYVGKRYSVEDIKRLNMGLTESVKILINEAAVAPRMDMKSVSLMVDDFYKSKINTVYEEPMNKKIVLKA